jgi:hypothetical protein
VAEPINEGDDAWGDLADPANPFTGRLAQTELSTLAMMA